jgi:hypothetical protein
VEWTSPCHPSLLHHHHRRRRTHTHTRPHAHTLQNHTVFDSTYAACVYAVLYIVVDDLRPDISPYHITAAPLAATPNFQRLANAVNFSSCYCCTRILFAKRAHTVRHRAAVRRVWCLTTPTCSRQSVVLAGTHSYLAEDQVHKTTFDKPRCCRHRRQVSMHRFHSFAWLRGCGVQTPPKSGISSVRRSTRVASIDSLSTN